MIFLSIIGGKKMKKISISAVIILLCGLVFGCGVAGVAVKTIGYTATGIKAAESIGKKSDQNASKRMWDPGKKKYYRIYNTGNSRGTKVYE